MLIKDATIDTNILFEQEELLKHKLTHVFTCFSEIDDKIHLTVSCETFKLDYDISIEKLSAFYSLIEKHILFLNKIECTHNLTNNDINVYLNMDYLLLDDIMVMLYEKEERK